MRIEQLNKPLPHHPRRAKYSDSKLFNHLISSLCLCESFVPLCKRLVHTKAPRKNQGTKSGQRLKSSLYSLNAFCQGVVVRAERDAQEAFALAAKRRARNRDHALLQQRLRHAHRWSILADVQHRVERTLRCHRSQSQLRFEQCQQMIASCAKRLPKTRTRR